MVRDCKPVDCRLPGCRLRTGTPPLWGDANWHDCSASLLNFINCHIGVKYNEHYGYVNRQKPDGHVNKHVRSAQPNLHDAAKTMQNCGFLMCFSLHNVQPGTRQPQKPNNWGPSGGDWMLGARPPLLGTCPKPCSLRTLQVKPSVWSVCLHPDNVIMSIGPARRAPIGQFKNPQDKNQIWCEKICANIGTNTDLA